MKFFAGEHGARGEKSLAWQNSEGNFYKKEKEKKTSKDLKRHSHLVENN